MSRVELVGAPVAVAEGPDAASAAADLLATLPRVCVVCAADVAPGAGGKFIQPFTKEGTEETLFVAVWCCTPHLRDVATVRKAIDQAIEERRRQAGEIPS